MPGFALTVDTLDPDLLKQELMDPRAGACVTFEGWVRNHNDGRDVHHLLYEAYPPLAASEGEAILEEARRKFGLIRAVAVHRTGDLQIGACAVWVGVSAEHRGEAFDACRYIIDEVKARVPIWKKEIYVSGVSNWVRCDHCAHHGPTETRVARDETALERQYYARHTVLPEVGAEGQSRLSATRALVVGAGALGCAALPYLAGAGIGHIAICDDDIVSLSNLHRQTLYTFLEEGKPKAQAAAEHLRARNPFIEVRALPFRLTEDNAAEVIEQYDVVVDGTDSLAAHFLLNDATVALGRILVQAALYQFEGQLFAWHPDDRAPDLRAVWAEVPEPGIALDCARAGILGPVAGTLGTLQAIETIKQVLKLPARLSGEMLLFDTMAQRMRRLRLPNAAPTETPGFDDVERDVCQVLTGSSSILVDIREEVLARETPFPAAGRVLPIDVTTDYAQALRGEQGEVVLCCSRGLRSRLIAQRLRREGLSHVWALRGGLHAWDAHHAVEAPE